MARAVQVGAWAAVDGFHGAVMSAWRRYLTRGSGSGCLDLEVLALVLGPVHRLAWLGPDPDGARAEAREALVEQLEHLYASRGAGHRELAVLGDWWLAASQQESPLQQAFIVADELPDWLGGPLLEVLSVDGPGPALATLRRPARFRRAREELAKLLEHTATLKKAPGPTIYSEAREDAFEVLRAIEQGRPRPPEVRLLTADCSAWASEERARQALQPGLKVWNTLHKHLQTFQAAAREAAECWSTREREAPALPPDWRDRARATFGEGVVVAEALLHDLAALRRDEPPPVALRPEHVLRTLDALPPDVDDDDRIRLLAFAREARSADPGATEPGWVATAEARLEALRGEVRTLLQRARARGVTDAVEYLSQSLEELDDLRSREAEAWIAEGRAALQSASQDAEIDRREQEATRWQTDLEGAGFPAGGAPLPTPDLDDLEAVRAWHASLEATWLARRQELMHELSDLQARAAALPRREDHHRLDQARAAASEASQKSALSRTARCVAELRAALDVAREAEEVHLAPEVTALSRRLDALTLASDERASARRAVQRIQARAEADLAYRDLLEAMQRWADAIERERLESLACLAVASGLGRVDVSPLCDPISGVLRRGRSRAVRKLPNGLDYALVRIGATGALEAPGPDDFAVVVDVASTSAHRPGELPRALSPGRQIFLRDAALVRGPYRLASGGLRPVDARGVAVTLERHIFEELFAVVALPAPTGAHIVLEPPGLQVLLDLGADPVDELSEEACERWLAALLDDVDAASAAPVARVMLALESSPLPDAIRAQRIRRLGQVLATSRQLASERERAHELYLRTEHGARAVEAAVQRLASAQVAAIEQHVAERKRSADAEIARVDQRIAEASARFSSFAEEALKREQALEAQLVELREEIAAAEALLEDRKARLLAELLARPAEGVLRDAAPAISDDVIRSRPVDGLVRRGLTHLLDDLGPRLPHLDRDRLGNLIACLLTSRWTLLAGPPGVGKSTLARDLATALGHGPGSERFLELVVRRDWQDDAALFGFWHPGRQAWEPGSEGVVELLLRARDDAGKRHGGLHTLLFEELNLAPPEHYLARFLSAFEARRPEIRLYADDLEPPNRHRHPPRVEVHDNVRLLGTVNVDETVERLSPRFLSRCTVVWIDPPIRDLLDGPRPVVEPGPPVDWADLLTQAATLPAPPLGPLRELVEFLHDERVPGAPTPRALRAIERYLAVASTLIPRPAAYEAAVVQRILPPLRGVGVRYRDLLHALTDRLERAGMQGAARQCERLRERGEELGDYYDLFHA